MTDDYYRFLISQNLIDQMERTRGFLQEVSNGLESHKNFKDFLSVRGGINTPSFLVPPTRSEELTPFDDEVFSQHLNTQVLLRMTFKETVSKYMTLYEDNKLDLPAQVQKNQDICPECSKALELFADDSEKRCIGCGYSEQLVGTLFDDNQFYNQQITCTKHKKHNPNNHCAKWLYQLQAKETKNITAKSIETLNQKAVKEYTRGGVKRSMNDLKCRQIRFWLKETKLAKLNNHAPLLRKIITGLNGDPIVPPQLTPEEEMKILADFSLAIEIFEVLSKKEEVLRLFNKPAIRNKLYYPFFLLKILLKHLRGDPRLPKLIECIHLQSSVTLTKDDHLWKMICTEMRKRGKKYNYEPTDRTILADVF
jgi:hypothetical protein